MFNAVCRTLKNRKGFTLVELMVVVVIIGVLASIAVPVYNNATQRAERSAVEANLRTIDGAIMQYQAINGTNPSDINALVTGGFLQAVPQGPGTATYTITTTTPIRAQVTSTAKVGGKVLSGESLPINWTE